MFTFHNLVWHSALSLGSFQYSCSMIKKYTYIYLCEVYCWLLTWIQTIIIFILAALHCGPKIFSSGYIMSISSAHSKIAHFLTLRYISSNQQLMFHWKTNWCCLWQCPCGITIVYCLTTLSLEPKIFLLMVLHLLFLCSGEIIWLFDFWLLTKYSVALEIIMDAWKHSYLFTKSMNFKTIYIIV